MSGIITRDGAAYLLNLFTNGEQPVANYYIALVGGNQPGISISGDELDEPSFSEYARGVLANQSGNWKIDNGLLINMIEVDFPMPSVDWGEIRYWAICDQPTAGRALFVGTFSSSFTVTANDQPYLPVAALSLDLGLAEWMVIE